MGECNRENTNLGKAQQWIKEVVPSNFQERLTQLRDKKAACELMTLKRQLWAQETIRERSTVNHCYRTFEEDLESDLEFCLDAFRVNANESAAPYPRQWYLHNMRYVWRFLLRRYARLRTIKKAGEVFRTLKEPLRWSFWRWANFLLRPRLFMCVLAGFLLLYSSGEIYGFVGDVVRLGYTFHAIVLLVPVMLILTATDVQRRVSRLSMTEILRRAGFLTALGIFYAGLGSAISHWLGGIMCRSHTWEQAICAGGAALILGMVFQQFWQESSLGEPL